MDPVFCKQCERWFPLTEEFWHRATNLPSGFATHMCKECRRNYTKDKAHKYRREKKLRELEKEQFMPGHFGPFEKAALKDRFESLTRPVISIYQEV